MRHIVSWKDMKLNVKFTIIIILFVMVPVICLSAYLFNYMKQTTIRQKIDDKSYAMENIAVQIEKNIESMTTTERYFSDDEHLLNFLERSVHHHIDTQEIIDFYDTDISTLERLVNNNPYLYQVRVYADIDTPEMIPILYHKDRLEEFSWAKDDPLVGWKYDYEDQVFSKSTLGDSEQKLMSKIAFIQDDYGENLAVLEVSMEMKTMFPQLYEKSAGEWGIFVDGMGNIYGDENSSEEALIKKILSELPTNKSTFFQTIDQGAYIVSYLPIEALNGTFISVEDISAELSDIQSKKWIFFTLLVLAFIFLSLLVNWSVKHLLKKLYVLLESIRKVQKGNLNVRIPESGRDEMGELGIQINKMLIQIRQLMEDNLNRERLVKNSEIKALQNQINVHFIYNVLETIKMMAEIDEKYEMSDAITALGKLLRYTMKWTKSNVTIKEELDYINNYMRLVNLRYDYEIYLSINIPKILYIQKIPKMSIQPIIENAIKHGIEEMAEDTTIYIKGYVEEDECVLEVTDSGKGMDSETLETLNQVMLQEIEPSGGEGHGIGLKNVQDRIKMSFGSRFGLLVASKKDCYTKVQLRIPMTVSGEQRSEVDE